MSSNFTVASCRVGSEEGVKLHTRIIEKHKVLDEIPQRTLKSNFGFKGCLVIDAFKSLVFPVILNGDNYLLWCRTTKNVLGGRGLLNHIEATTDMQIKETGFDKAKWEQEDMNVLCALQTSLEASILETYSYCESSKELWDTLKNVFENVSNLTRFFEVKRAINNLSQEDMDFKKHFGKFRSLWAEFEMLRPNTTDLMVLNERREQDKVFGFLLSLSSSYNDLIKHILKADKLPTLDEVCFQLQREHGSQGFFGGQKDLPMTNKKSHGKIWVCDHCKKKGHMKDKCWILHPHLKPNKFKDSSANMANENAQVGRSNKKKAMVVSSQDNISLSKSDLEFLFQSIASKMHAGKK